MALQAKFQLILFVPMNTFVIRSLKGLLKKEKSLRTCFFSVLLQVYSRLVGFTVIIAVRNSGQDQMSRMILPEKEETV